MGDPKGYAWTVIECVHPAMHRPTRRQTATLILDIIYF
jgi:hypothetical protein